MIKPALTQAPTEYPVSLAAIKAHLRVDHDDENELINVLIAAATDHLDGYGGILGKCLMRQTWRVSADRFCSPKIRLPFSDIVSVEVKYTNPAEQEMIVDVSNYELLEDSLGAFIQLSPAFPYLDLANTEDPAWVDMIVGAENADDVPPSIVLAMKMMIANWYEQRDGHSANRGLPPGVESILAPHRKVRL